MVNRARLFDERFEREEKLNRGHIIRYLNDQVRKIEKTWTKMQLFVGNMEPVRQGTQTPDLSTPTKLGVEEAGMSKTATLDIADDSDS